MNVLLYKSYKEPGSLSTNVYKNHFFNKASPSSTAEKMCKIFDFDHLNSTFYRVKSYNNSPHTVLLGLFGSPQSIKPDRPIVTIAMVSEFTTQSSRVQSNRVT